MKHHLYSWMLLLLMVLTGSSALQAQTGPQRVYRYRTLYAGKNLVVTTKNGKSYFYFVQSEEPQLMSLSGDSLTIAGDRYAKADIKGMRMKEVPKILLNEDSTVFTSRTVEHALLAFRRSLAVGKWNSLVVPFEMTGKQVRETFGEDCVVAKVKGVTNGDETILEFDTEDVQKDGVVISASTHYLIRPTREPDVAANQKLYLSFDDVHGIQGPVYVIPDVTLGKSTTATARLYTSDDETAKIRIRGTYLRLDNSVMTGRVIRNKKAAPGSYVLNEEGVFEQHADSVTIPGFQSWLVVEEIADASRLRFFVNGVEEEIGSITSAIAAITGDDKREMGAGEVYDMTGRQVARLKRGQAFQSLALPAGVYMVNGKKYLKR
ncbi:MAG: hypothetical protein IJ910_00535 [Bacteroidaceae bacterium]|nr:hypothetical protein [Bacteroidaceae bacterium]